MRHNITKVTLLFLVVVLLLSNVQAEELKQIYDGFAPYGVNFTAGNKIFSIGGKSTLDPFIVNLPNGSMILVSDSKCYSKDVFVICYNGSSERDYQNYTLDKIYYKPAITISEYISIEAGIEIEKTYEYDEPALVQDPISVIIKLKNNAVTSAKGIVLKDSVPTQFTVTSSTGCEYFGHNIRWYGSLNPRESHLCRYIMIPQENTTYNTVASVEYLLNDAEKTVYSNAGNITILIPLLEIEEFISNDSLKVGDVFFYSINMSNLDEEEDMIVTKMDVFIPRQIKVLQYHPKFSEERYGLSFKDLLEKQENITLWFLAGAVAGGNISLNTTINYRIRQVPTIENLKTEIFIEKSENEENISFDDFEDTNMTLEDFDHLGEIDNISEVDNISEIDNVTVIPQQPIVDIVEEKKSYKTIIVIGIVAIAALGLGILIYIKKRKKSYF